MRAVWNTSLSFGRIPVESDGPQVRPVDVFTSGPIAHDLVALAEPSLETIVRLGGTIGFEWIASLVEVDRLPEMGDSVLSRFLSERYALRPGSAINPYQLRGQRLVRSRPQPISRDLL